MTFGPAPGVPVDVTCSCGWFARARGADPEDAEGVGRALLEQHLRTAHKPTDHVKVKIRDGA